MDLRPCDISCETKETNGWFRHHRTQQLSRQAALHQSNHIPRTPQCPPSPFTTSPPPSRLDPTSLRLASSLTPYPYPDRVREYLGNKLEPMIDDLDIVKVALSRWNRAWMRVFSLRSCARTTEDRMSLEATRRRNRSRNIDVLSTTKTLSRLPTDSRRDTPSDHIDLSGNSCIWPSWSRICCFA
jgi:hypothetical protein